MCIRDRDMAAVISLGVLATCLQGKYKIEGTPGYCEPLSLYTVVIAAPGERKSSVMRDMTTFLYEYEQEYNKAHSMEIRENHLQRESMERLVIFLLILIEECGCLLYTSRCV